MDSAALGTVRPAAVLAPLGVWLLLAVLAVFNGAFRETLLVERTSEYRAHVLSTAMLVVLILVVSDGFFAWSGRSFSDAELVGIGILWTVLTVGFEFLVGYAEGTPVSTTLGQYDVTAGQVWIVVPLTQLVVPYVFGSVLDV